MVKREEAGRVFVACSDLMFSAGIREEGASLGVALVFIDSQEKFDEALEIFRPVLLMSDLHHHKLGGERAGALVKKLKAGEKTKDADAVAWGKHTEPELLKSARRWGFDRVMPRSLFVKEMPDIVRRAARRAQAIA